MASSRFIVDTGFRNGEGTVKAYVSVNLALGDRQLAAQFQEIPLDLRNRIGCPRRKLDTDRRFQDTNKRWYKGQVQNRVIHLPISWDRAEFYIKFIGVYSHQCTIAAGGVEHAVAGSSIYVHDHSGTETRFSHIAGAEGDKGSKRLK
ncbi:hypothetical protein V6N13_122114 [Hibiscus sabdariffa]